MKSMKGKLLKKLKTIKSIGYIKPERFLHVNASDGYFEAHLPEKSAKFQKTQKDAVFVREEVEPEIIDVYELMKDLEDEKIEYYDEKENIRPKKVDEKRGFLDKGKIKSEKSIFDEKGNEKDIVLSNQDLGKRDFDDDDENVEFYNVFSEKENIKPEKEDENRGIPISEAKNGKIEAKESRFGEMKNDPLTMRRDFEEFDDFCYEEENIRVEKGKKNREFSVLETEKRKVESLESSFEREKTDSLLENDDFNFRGPDLDSKSLFDPNLLAAFEQALKEFKAEEAEKIAEIKEKEKYIIVEKDEEPLLKSQGIDPLLDFEEKCPPGGSHSVILYTTGLRSIRKTFEDCQSIRFLLENFKVLFIERDISMHCEFREELWRLMGEKLVPPCLFIKGRYIGGAEKVLSLHEQGKFRPLFVGVPIDRGEGPCRGCGGARFVVCFTCNGSRKAEVFDGVAVAETCLECNENGLIICPICC